MPLAKCQDHLQSEAGVKNKESTVLHAFSRGKISVKEIESQFITTEKNRIQENNKMDSKGPTQHITLQEMLLWPSYACAGEEAQNILKEKERLCIFKKNVNIPITDDQNLAECTV